MDDDEEHQYDEEEFPAPPTQDEVNNNLFEVTELPTEQTEEVGHHEEVEPMLIERPPSSFQPAPPPRDSSLDYMMEYHNISSSSATRDAVEPQACDDGDISGGQSLSKQ